MPTDATATEADFRQLADDLDREPAARGAVYGLLATTLDEPSHDLHAALADGSYATDLRALVDRTDLDASVPTVETDDDHETLCARFNDLFRLGGAEYADRTDGSLDAEGPPVPMHETRYREEAWNAVNRDLARAYEHFGLGVDETNRRHHDHVRLELEFAAYLCRREAAVDEDAARARLDFLHRHLQVLAEGMADRVKSEPGTDVYGPLVEFLRAFVAADAEDLERRVET